MKIEASSPRSQPLRRMSALVLPAFLTLIAGLIGPLGASAQTVDEVIAKNIQAHGGLEKLKAVQHHSNHRKIHPRVFSRGLPPGK